MPEVIQDGSALGDLQAGLLQRLFDSLPGDGGAGSGVGEVETDRLIVEIIEGHPVDGGGLGPGVDVADRIHVRRAVFAKLDHLRRVAHLPGEPPRRG